MGVGPGQGRKGSDRSDEGLSLTVWATVFSVNSLKGKEGCVLFARILSLRAFRRVEIVLSKSLLFCFFKPYTSSASQITNKTKMKEQS